MNEQLITDLSEAARMLKAHELACLELPNIVWAKINNARRYLDRQLDAYYEVLLSDGGAE